MNNPSHVDLGVLSPVREFADRLRSYPGAWSDRDLNDLALVDALFVADVARQIAREARREGLPADTLGLDPRLLEALADHDSNIVVLNLVSRRSESRTDTEPGSVVETLTRASNAPGVAA